MALSDRVKDALRTVFGQERDERSQAESPSAEAEVRSAPSSYGLMGTTETAGLLSVSNRLMDRYADYECFTGDTPVLTLEGPVAIGELARRCAEDPSYEFPVFTWDHQNRRVTVGMASGARETKTDRVIEITLDNGFAFRCTPDHPIMLRDGQYCPAGELRPGVSLMPLYLKLDNHGYPIYQENEDWHKGGLTLTDQTRWRKVSRMVAEWQIGSRLPPLTDVRHLDGNRENYTPSNLRIARNFRSPQRSKQLPPVMVNMAHAKEFVASNNDLARTMLSSKRRDAIKRLYNHKVAKIERKGVEPVYDISVAPTRNFVIGGPTGGIFVHNSMNDYPEVHCFAEGTQVYVKHTDGVIRPTEIEKLLGEDDGALELVAFDRKTEQITFVDPQHARLESNEAEVIKVPLENGRTLRVTPDHLVLVNRLGYVEARDLVKGSELIGFMAGLGFQRPFFLTHRQAGIVKVAEDPSPDGVARVFDITTSTHNFMAEGVICHNSAFHYFANDATQPNADTGKMIWVESADEAIRSTGNATLHKKLRVDDEMFSIAYTTAMYGNDYEEVLVTENGVVGLNFLPPPTMRRIERSDGALIGYIQDLSGQFPVDMRQLRQMLASAQGVPENVALFEDWQVLHFRQRGSFRRSPYGFSVAEGARWIWKRLLVLEDAVLIYKLSRAPSRYAFYIDVSDVPPDRVKSFLNRAKNDFKKKQIVDPRTGKLTMRFNPLANDEDFFLATREGKDLARVDILSGPDYQAVDDVMYFLRKLHGVLKVPRSYMGFDDQVPGRSILSNEDVRAARVTLGLQRSLRLGFERLIRIDMAARGMGNIWRPEFEVMMTAPSAIYSLAAMEWKNAQADFASRVLPFTSLRWVQENVFKFSGDQIDAIERQLKREREMGMGGDVGFMGASFTPDDIPNSSLLERDRGDIPTRRELVKMIDNIRRNEDMRDRESRKRHDELVESMQLLASRHKSFEKRLSNYRQFGQELQEGVLPKVNGRVSPAPVNRRIRRLVGVR